MDPFEAIGHVGDVLLSYLTNTDQRLQAGYLCSALLLACWVYRKSPSKRGFLRTIFNTKIWWSDSAKVDYKLVVFNGFVKVLLLTQFVTYGIHLAYWTSDTLATSFGASTMETSTLSWLAVYTLTITLVGDFSVYVVHRAMHSVPSLWAFHSVHHSATTLTPVTQLRLHPIELVINNARSIVVFGLITGAFHYGANGRIELFTLFGTNILSVAFFAFGANLRHSHIRLAFWHPLEKVFMSPLQHQIHHSDAAEHHNRNYGSKLALWDFLFGTWIPSRNVGKLTFGLGQESSHEQTLAHALMHPIRSGLSEDAPIKNDITLSEST